MSLRYIYGDGIIVASASLDLNATSSATSLFYIGSSELPNNRSLEITIPSGSTGENVDTTALFITASGKDPFLGIGTTKPESLLEIKSTQTSSKGSSDFILAVPNVSSSQGNESSRISFVIEDQTLSGSKSVISGSTGAIFSRVLSDPSTTGYQFGSLVFEVDGPDEDDKDTKGLEIGYGLNPFLGSTIASIFTGSVVLGGDVNSPTPGVYVNNYQNEQLAYLGQDIVNPVNTDSGQLILYYNNVVKTIFRTEPGEDSFINVDANGTNGSNFGIGTSTPSERLHVVNNGKFTGFITASNAQFTSIPAGSETTFLTVDGSGNVKTRTSGANGSSGSSGTSGATGASGSSGSSGTSGATGASGSSGSSGSSGTSGTSPTIANDVNNRVTTAVGDGTLNAETNLTFNGNDLTVSGDIEAESILVKTTGISSTGDYGAGSRIYIGSDVGTIAAGKVYYLASTGWELSNSSAESTARGFLAVRTSTGTTSVSGMLIEGVIKVGTNLSSSNVGDKIYLLNADGALTTTLPTTAGLYVRIVGYVITPSTSVIYFNPSPDYIELA